MFLTWLVESCESHLYAFKGDDDILLNPFRLEHFIQNDNSTEPTIFGCSRVSPASRKSDNYFRPSALIS